MEQWGFINLQIPDEKIKQKIIADSNKFRFLDLNDHKIYFGISFSEHFDENEDILIKNEIFTLLKKYPFKGIGSNENDNNEEYNLTGEINDFKISRFWSITILDKDEIKKYGFEKIKNAPCEIIEIFDDFAYLQINKSTCASIFKDRQALRKYFGENKIKEK